MVWRCTKCFQEWGGYGNTCNDCIRREQLEEQNKLIRDQATQAERRYTYHNLNTSEQHWDLYKNNPVYQQMVDAHKVVDAEHEKNQKIFYKKLEKEANLFDTLNCIIWCFIIYFVDLYLFKGFFCRALLALITGIFEMCFIVIKTVFFGN